MNDNDKNNLNFLLTASKNSIEKWYYAMDKDDHDYALELLNEYSRQLDIQMEEVSTELMVEAYDDFPEAKMVLDRIMSMGV